MKIEIKDLENFGRGAAFLGTGGGGDPYIGRMLATSAIQEFGMPEVLEPESIDDDATVFTMAMLGSPVVLAEKIPSGEDMELAIKGLERRLGKKVDVICPVEIGGGNSLIPVVAAARLGLPLVNADSMGRAFPELQMTTFNVFGVPCTPMTVTDEHSNLVLIETATAKRAEDLTRVSSIEMGCSVMVSTYPMNGKQLKETCVPGTLTMSLEIGRAIERGRKYGDPVKELCDYLRKTPYYNQCKVLFDGKVVDLIRETRKGFSVGKLMLDAIDGSDRRMEIEFQNEHLIARENGILKAVVPDLICTVDRETAEPVPVPDLKYGQRLKVIGVSAAPIMRKPESLNVFGPRCFGLDEDFVPIEQLF